MRVFSTLVFINAFGVKVCYSFVPFTSKPHGVTPRRNKLILKSGMDEEDSEDAGSFLVGIVGDLHIDPRKMEDYETGKEHWTPIFDKAKKNHGNAALVSLGDLGESKNCDHNDSIPSELFAGTTLCHEIASEYLGSFGVPYEVIGGNHDLEGIDEV